MFGKVLIIVIVVQLASFISCVELRREYQRKAAALLLNKGLNRDLSNLDPEQRQTTCFPPITCNPNYPYRSSDGTCNNLNNPYWGSAPIPFQRLLTPQYGDGFNSPRGTGQNPPLPGPRKVSVKMVNTAIPTKNDNASLMVMQFAQFTDHDLTLTPDDEEEACCGNFVSSTSTSPSCMPINVIDDAFYNQNNVKCLPFSRSTRAPCATGPRREQMNVLTSFIDNSNVYGSSATELTALRELNSWRLRFGPLRENSSCSSTDSSFRCRTYLPIRANEDTGEDEFFGGDIRVEEQPGLTSMHHVPVRMHNDLGRVIRNLNPSFSNEIVFQETRKLVNALFQQFTYNEFLPFVLGTEEMSAKGLYLVPVTPTGSPYLKRECYNKSINPTVFNEFAAASFRFGHTLIKNNYTMKPSNIQVELKKSFFNHARTTIANTFPSNFLWGIAVDPAEEVDHILVKAIQSFLFAESPFAFGQDLYARNIMRARDHGVPSYATVHNACYHGAIQTFSDLTKYMPSEVVQALNELYGGRVNDIDLFPAAMAEYNVPEGLLGRTFACLNAVFFQRAKYGDRFWFELENYFKIEQLRSIRRTRFSSILCMYTNADCLPLDVFRQTSPSANPCTPCSQHIQTGIVKDISTHWNNYNP